MAGTETQGPLEVGQKFLKYRIVAQIGRGGHAWVYHGHDPFLDNEVAIKILHRHGGATADMLRRGQAEAKLLFRLRHPNIVEVQDAGISEDGLLYIVMELLRGKSLRDVLTERGRLPLREALELFVDLTQGVEAAHAFGAIHRDLKPENVFRLEDGSSKILDFGIAKVVDVAGITTERDVLHGTILYISPEQLEGHRATPRSDLYALGLVLFEALYGRHPLLLKETNPTVRELSLMQIGFRPPSLNELDASIPRHVARIVERLLLKSPAQRPQTTQELRAALDEALRRIDTDGSSRPAGTERAATDQVRLFEDTERIPLGLLPDQTESSEVTPVQMRRREPAASAPSPRPVTAPPLTTGVPREAPRRTSSERETARQRATRALVAGAVAGVGLGAGYLLVEWQSATRAFAVDPPAASARALRRETTSAGTSAGPLALPASSVVASATLAPAPSATLAPPAPAPAVSHSAAVTNRPRHVVSTAKSKRDTEALHPSADLDHRPWIE